MKKTNKPSQRKPSTYRVGPVGGEVAVMRHIPAAQCNSVDRLTQLRCQGVHRHDGEHWCYKHDGMLCRWKYRKNIKGRFDTAASQTPPGHWRYVHPKDMEPYWQFDRTEQVGTEQDDWVPDEKAAKVVRQYEKQAKRKARLRGEK